MIWGDLILTGLISHKIGFLPIFAKIYKKKSNTYLVKLQNPENKIAPSEIISSHFVVEPQYLSFDPLPNS